MKLYHETERKIAALLGRRGFSAHRGDSVLCSDRSLKGTSSLEEGTGVDEGALAEVTFDLEGAELYEVMPTDLPPARYFDLPAELVKGIVPSLVS